MPPARPCRSLPVELAPLPAPLPARWRGAALPHARLQPARRVARDGGRGDVRALPPAAGRHRVVDHDDVAARRVGRAHPRGARAAALVAVVQPLEVVNGRGHDLHIAAPSHRYPIRHVHRPRVNCFRPLPPNASRCPVFDPPTDRRSNVPRSGCCWHCCGMPPIPSSQCACNSYITTTAAAATVTAKSNRCVAAILARGSNSDQSVHVMLCPPNDTTTGTSGHPQKHGTLR